MSTPAFPEQGGESIGPNLPQFAAGDAHSLAGDVQFLEASPAERVDLLRQELGDFWRDNRLEVVDVLQYGDSTLGHVKTHAAYLREFVARPALLALGAIEEFYSPGRRLDTNKIAEAESSMDKALAAYADSQNARVLQGSLGGVKRLAEITTRLSYSAAALYRATAEKKAPKKEIVFPVFDELGQSVEQQVAEPEQPPYDLEWEQIEWLNSTVGGQLPLITSLGEQVGSVISGAIDPEDFKQLATAHREGALPAETVLAQLSGMRAKIEGVSRQSQQSIDLATMLQGHLPVLKQWFNYLDAGIAAITGIEVMQPEAENTPDGHRAV